MESWQELGNPRDLTKIFTTPGYAAWRSLRDSEDSRYIGLAMPRFLARLPYGAKTDPVEEFDFEEDTERPDASKYIWANAAYAMAVNINRSFKLYGWCSRIRGIESGGAVEGLPTHTFPTDDGGVDMNCPTEIAHQRSPRSRAGQERVHAVDPQEEHRLRRRSSARSRCRSRPYTMIRTRPRTPTWRPGCRICSRPAASRTT